MENLLALGLADVMGKPLWLWLTFISLVFCLLAFDLGVLNKKDHDIGVTESLKLSAFYISIAVIFGGWIWWIMGETAAVQYYTGFFIEKSLSLDNVFVISLIFAYFAVPRELQHRVLFWGILGVIMLRGVMIGVGAALVSEFEWMLNLFGAFLLLTGVKMLLAKDAPPDIKNNPMLKLLRRKMAVTDAFHGRHFFIRLPKNGDSGPVVRHATPLFLALMMIEAADLIFAVDSVPAIFAITTDPYIVYTSNIFAILGLRALYFALAAMVRRFDYLKYALALVLVFIGGKIFWSHFYGKLDPVISLGVTMALLTAGVLVSLLKNRNAAAKAETETETETA